MQKTGKEIPCYFCGKIFYIPLWRLRKARYHFCSQSCLLKWLHGRNISYSQCPQCNKIFRTTCSSSIKFCSRECYAKWRSEHLRGKNNWRYKTHHTQETIDKIRESNLAKWQDAEFRQKRLSIYRSQEYRKQQSENMLALWQDENYIRKTLGNRNLKPSKPEIIFNTFLQQYFPNKFEYVGDYRFWVKLGKFHPNGRRHLNPDFKRINSKINGKKLIELFGDYYHRSENPQDIINAYADVNWNCLVIWEHELKDEHLVMTKVKQFLGD